MDPLPDQTNYNIKQPQNNSGTIKILVAVIVILLAVIGAGLFYFYKYQPAIKTQPVIQNLVTQNSPPTISMLPPSVIPSVNSQNPQVSTTSSNPPCPKDTIKEFGTINNQNDVLVYSTECAITLYGNNSTDSLIRFYVRDAKGTFNKKVFEVFNKSTFGGLTYGDILDNSIRIHRVTSGEDSKTVNIFGAEVKKNIPEENLPNFIQDSFSPNRRYQAFNYGSDVGGDIRVTDTQTGQTKKYDLTSSGLNGAYFAGWSADSNTLYVMGGIWEFSAPAVLWSIDMNAQKISEYSGLSKFNFPVSVFSSDGMALLSNHGASQLGDDNPSPIKTDLYLLDLKSGNKNLIASETAVWAFSPIELIGNDIYYEVSPTNNTSVIKKLNLGNLTSTVLYKDNSHLLDFILDKEWLVTQKDSTFKFFSTKTLEEQLIGSTGNKPGYANPTDGTEYFGGIVGVIKASSND